MSLILFVLFSFASARAAWPSGFHPDQCARLLDETPVVVPLATFRAAGVADKIRDVHAKAHVIQFVAQRTADERVTFVLNRLLAGAEFHDLDRRLRTLGKVSRAQREPYAVELLEIGIKLGPLLSMIQDFNVNSTKDLGAFYEAVVKMSIDGLDAEVQHSLSMARLSLAMIQGDLARRANAPGDLLRESLANLERASLIDHAGARKAVVLAGLPQVLGNFLLASLRLSTNDLERMDGRLARVLRNEMDSFAREPVGFEVIMDLYADLNQVITADHLPELRDVFDDVVGPEPGRKAANPAPEPRARKMH